jgi:integral membrane protein (TIGR01906 family)
MTVTRAPASRLTAGAFLGGVMLAILLTGPLLLFNPIFVGLEQRRQDVHAALGVEWETVDRVTGELLGDLFLGGDFDTSPGLLDASERMHMRDVSGLVRILALLDAVAIVTLLLAGRRLRAQHDRRGRLLLVAAATVGGAAVLLGLVFALAFDAAFTVFHGLFFAAGTWQFGPDSNLIRLFPEPFWYETAIVAGVLVVLSALVAAAVGRRDLAAPRD